MAKKGTPKNTKNKAKYSKLMDRKKNKARKEKDARTARLKEIIKGAKTQNEESEEN